MTTTKKPAKLSGNKPTKMTAVVVGAAVVALLVLVLVAQWLRTLPSMQSFLADYPGHTELPAGAPTGLPAWLGWQHFLNAFFILLIIRSGWQVRTTTRPKANWTRNNKGLIRTKNPPSKISLDLWFHLTMDALWILNGIVFMVLLLATRQWLRIVPTSWDIIPNALSAALQYASLSWPTENGWLNYNALQVLAYFTTVFIAAPLALVTGLRMSGAWPRNATKLNKAYPIELARAIHFPVMLYFVFFIIVHVALVLATGALRNLNHMYASRDDGSWVGFWIFAASLAVMIAAWFLARPLFLRPIASLTGKVSR
jgi:thiosulfate reductase cytochrome b subunit